MTSRKGRHFLLSLDLWIPLAILILTTFLFNRYAWDMRIQAAVYSDGWHYNSLRWVQLLYRFGNIPALLVTIGALGVFLLGFRNLRLIKYRKLSAYMVLAMVLGPGLIVNSILKDNWGRPRPRDVVEFGGKYAYEAPLVLDQKSSGKSFPCGHATMGFYFFTLGFATRGIKRKWSGVILLLGLGLGSLIGAARVLQGGHFTSDVIWAGGLIYLVSFGLWRIMRLQAEPYYVSKTTSVRRLNKLQTAAIIMIGLLIVLGVSLATPYSSQKEFLPDAQIASPLELALQRGDLTLNYGDEYSIKTEASGFGFPGSKVKYTMLADDGLVRISQSIKGYFTELSCRVAASVDTTRLPSYHVSLASGEIILRAPKSFIDTVFVSPDCDINNPDSSIEIKQIEPLNRHRIMIDAPKLMVVGM